MCTLIVDQHLIAGPDVSCRTGVGCSDPAVVSESENVIFNMHVGPHEFVIAKSFRLVGCCLCILLGRENTLLCNSMSP